MRIPRYRPDREVACRMELRSPDPAANPYLAFAVMLAAGLRGHRGRAGAAAPHRRPATCSACRARTCARRALSTLPESLGEAVELFAASELMRETLGDHIHGYLVNAKRADWNEYQGFVTAVGARPLSGGAVAMRGGREARDAAENRHIRGRQP